MAESTFLPRVADDWWARDFGCLGAELRPARTRVQEHTAGLAGDGGIWILVAGGAPMVSLPSDLMGPLGELARTWSVSDVAAVVSLERQVARGSPRPIEKVVGPAFIGYGSADTLDLTEAGLAIPISSPPLVAELQAACAREEWDHGGSEPHAERTFGVLLPSGELGALAGYEVWNGSIAHISIATRPSERGRGLGSAAVARAAQHALRAGLVPQYRTLRSNAPSMRLGERLGFVEYGFSVYFRVRAA